MGQLNIAREKFWDFVERTREEFSTEEYEENSELKWWDLCILCIGGYLKEIIELLIGTFTNESSIHSLIKTWPFNGPPIWVLLLKVLIGGLLLIYFGFRLTYLHSPAITSWYVFVFITWSILRSSIEYIFPSREFLTIFHLFLLPFFYFWFFFNKDRGNINAWKIIFYRKSSLYRDNYSWLLMKGPGTLRSREKSQKMITIILISFVLMVFWSFTCEEIIKAIKSYAKGDGEGVDIRPKNQKIIERGFRDRWLLIVISAIIKAPIQEELVFRRCLMKLGNNRLWIALLSGFLFSLMHLKNESFSFLFIYLMNGIMLSLLVWMTRNIWFSVFSHGLWNTVGVMNLFWKLIGGRI